MYTIGHLGFNSDINEPILLRKVKLITCYQFKISLILNIICQRKCHYYQFKFSVPLRVLREQYEAPQEHDELNAPVDNENDDGDDDFDGYDTGDEFIRESAASPASPSSPNTDGTQRDNNLTKDSPESSTNSPLSKGSHVVKSTDTEAEEGMLVMI